METTETTIQEKIEKAKNRVFDELLDFIETNQYFDRGDPRTTPHAQKYEESTPERSRMIENKIHELSVLLNSDNNSPDTLTVLQTALKAAGYRDMEPQ